MTQWVDSPHFGSLSRYPCCKSYLRTAFDFYRVLFGTSEQISVPLSWTGTVNYKAVRVVRIHFGIFWLQWQSNFQCCHNVRERFLPFLLHPIRISAQHKRITNILFLHQPLIAPTEPASHPSRRATLVVHSLSPTPRRRHIFATNIH